MTWSVAVCVVVAAVSALGGCARETTVLLVRHAEKAAEGSDPGLTPEGAARAGALAEIASRERVQAIYVTPYRRTRDTAEPSAETLHVTPQVVPVSSASAHATEVAADIRQHWEGKSVLVVGHSNTVPLVMTALGAAGKWEIGEGEFDRLFILRWTADGPVRVTESRYGE
jgi:broad specificity phosphatase PhoE